MEGHLGFYRKSSTLQLLRCSSVLIVAQALEGQLNSYELTLLIPGALLSYINADLGPDPSYTWIAVCWSLGAAVLASIAGRLSDIFGRRYFMLLGSFLGFVGTIVGATGQNITQMIFSGVIFGVSGSPFSYAPQIITKLSDFSWDPRDLLRLRDGARSQQETHALRWPDLVLWPTLPLLPPHRIRDHEPYKRQLARLLLVHDRIRRCLWLVPVLFLPPAHLPYQTWQ